MLSPIKLCFNLTNLLVFGLHLMAKPHPGDRAGGEYRRNQKVSLFVSPGETESNRKYAHMRHRVFDFHWGGGVSTDHFKLLRVLNPEGRWSRLLPVPLQEVVLSQAGVVAALREDLASQELFEAGTEGDGPPLVPTDLPSAVTQVAFHMDRRLASIVLLTEPSCAASGSEEAQFATVTGVQGPVSSEAPAQEVSGTLSKQDMSLSSLAEF